MGAGEPGTAGRTRVRLAAAAQGETLCHADLRADNLLLTADAVMVVDWPYAVTGARWVDALLFLPSVAATSSIDSEQAWTSFRPSRGGTRTR